MTKSQDASVLSDRSQNFWQLACIQASGNGAIPIVIVGAKIAAQHGPISGITSVILGNLILWIVGMAIISMSIPSRDNAMQNVNHYLGKIGSIVAAVFLILAFISWYTLQINSANIVIKNLVLHNVDSLRLGAGIGSFVALLSIGGIYLIKKYCTFIFPFLLAFVIYSIFMYFGSFKFHSSWNFSLLGIFSIVSVNLAGIVNLPTFFRHSRSPGDSYLGLSLMILFTMLFQIYAVVGGLRDAALISSDNAIYTFFLVAFIIFSLISVNLVNIYFASAGWEMIFPHRKSNKEFAIVGLLGTLAYTFFQITAPMQFILDTAENFITSLGIVLFLSFLTKTFERHRPKSYEKFINLSCWFLGAIAGTIYSSKGHIGSPKTLIISFSTTILAFLFIVYVEETYWSAKKIILEPKK